MNRRDVVPAGIAVGMVAVLVGASLAVDLEAGATVGLARIPVDHLVFVIMENHAYDNYFGTYCQQVGPYCPQAANGLPVGICLPRNVSNPAAGCVRPYDYPPPAVNGTPDIAHTWTSTHRAYDNGLMDGFFSAEGNSSETYGHYNGSTIPVYWDMAQEFGLGDNFYSSSQSFSLPNHWHLVSGTNPPIFNAPGNFLATASTAHTYLNEANRTATINDLLERSNLTWKYYQAPLAANYTNAIQYNQTGSVIGSAYTFWAPLAGKAESYLPAFDRHFDWTASYFSDLANGSLPQVSWVIPGGRNSDHPPWNISSGEQFVSSVVDSTEASPFWKSTAIFVLWDDYGGFYDHVAPPQLFAGGLSFRVPLLVFSPYTPAGLVDHQELYLDSLVHLIEWRFGLPCLGQSDCSAPLPYVFFDTKLSPRAPLYFPNNATGAHYPVTNVNALASNPGVAPPARQGGAPIAPNLMD